MRMVRRDFLIHHQQTLLGPLWILVQPIIVLFIYVMIFEKAVGLSTDGENPTLFYLSGIILWSLFSETFSGTSFTFSQNGQLFSKVYFPRLLVPFSIVALNYVRFAIQFALFIILLIALDPGHIMKNPLEAIASLAVVVVITSGIGLGGGLIFSILTAKYRDLVNMMHLFIRIMMFATPVIYPLSAIDPAARQWLNVNPLTPLFELFRFAFMGSGSFELSNLIYSTCLMIVMLVVGSMLFNKFGNKLQDVL